MYTRRSMEDLGIFFANINAVTLDVGTQGAPTKCAHNLSAEPARSRDRGLPARCGAIDDRCRDSGKDAIPFDLHPTT